MSIVQLPPFRLISHDGSVVNSDDIDGWFLLYWYPKADTPGCVAQAESLRDNFEAFGDFECRVFGASFDPPASNRAFRDKYRIPFVLLSDEYGTAALSMAAAKPDARHPNRIALLVDRHKNVVRRYDVTDPCRFAELVLDDLERLTTSDRLDDEH